MAATYNAWLVALSIVVAVAVSYTALKLAARVADSGRAAGKLWLIGGAAAMGMGIWSMHFIGMLAYSVEIPLRYSIAKTVLSMVIAMITSGFALALAGRSQLGLGRLAAGSLVMGAGICAMHYSGMSAIQIMPILTYQPGLVLASVGIAVGASFAALWLAFKLRRGRSRTISWARAGAAIVMGLAICGMHYTGMAATRLAVGSICFGGATLDNNWMAVTIALVALGVLGLTLITAVYDAHLVSQSRQDAKRLEQVNAALQHEKNLLTLATRAAGISSWELDLASRRTLWTENDIDSLRQAGVDSSRRPDAVLELTHPDDREVMCEAVQRALREKRDVCAYRFRVVAPGGEVFHLQAHARIFLDDAGHPLRMLGVSWDITGELLAEQRKLELQAKLRDASRDSGMAEVATGVLHNVGNVLNSLGVSAAMIQTRLRESRAGNVTRAARLMSEQRDLSTFMADDDRGRQLPGYLAQLGENLEAERVSLQGEIEAISAHVGHIRNIVAAQQTYARRGGVTEAVDLAELLDSAIAMHFTEFAGVSVRREYQASVILMLDRHKVIQILGNLLSNARHALKSHVTPEARLTLRIREADNNVYIDVEDTGVGIEAAVIRRLFEFGFTTKKEGHGFGLHNSAILAKELGGELVAASDGPGQGARFTLRLPAQAAAARKQA